jgi:hypothetical protein
MPLRIIVCDVDSGYACNVGGPVAVNYRTFDIDAPEVEAFLREPSEKKWSYSQRTISGVEVLAAKEQKE